LEASVGDRFEQESRQGDHSAQALTGISIAPTSQPMCALIIGFGNASQLQNSGEPS
jgi:hypothetical protein